MPDHLGNVFDEVAKAINAERDQFLLDAARMRQVVEVHNAVVDAKNDLVRENWRLAALVEDLAGRVAAQADLLARRAERPAG